MSVDGPSLPGRIERLGGREVHWVHEVGAQPLVVLLGGCGVPCYRWDEVIALLPGVEVARIDRPGIGGTRWPQVLPRLADEVATVADLIARLGGPAVVVGHSMGGLYAEAVARLHPDLVTGLVLIDGSVEHHPRRPGSGAAWLRTAKAAHTALGVPLLRPLGSLADRLLTASQSRRRVLDPGEALARAVYRDPEAVASVIAEQAAYAQQIWDLAAIRRSSTLPGIPVVVLTAARDGGARWVAKQRKLAELLAARQVVVDDSRHLMMLDRPDVVAHTVLEVRERPGMTVADEHG